MENTYKIFESIEEMQIIINAFESISREYQLCFSITGSVLSGQYKQSMDVDLIIILPDKFFLDKESFLPTYFSPNFWEKRLEKKYLLNIDVIGSHCKRNPAIRLEIYKESSAYKILNQSVFKISRLKDVPKNNKIELFINDKGAVIHRRLDKFEELSTTVSFLKEKDDLYWGMHFERLLLADKLIDSLNFNQTTKIFRRMFLEKLKDNNDIQNLFYVSRHYKMIDIYSHLLS